MNGELARRSAGKYSSNVRVLRCNSRICYVPNIDALVKAYRFPSCDQLINEAGNLERHLTTCKERNKHIFPKNVYQLRETLFEKLDYFSSAFTDNQVQFILSTIFDFESICVEDENFNYLETTTMIGKLIPVSVKISSNLIQEAISSVILILVTWYHI